MFRKINSHSKRVRNMVVASSLIAIVLSVSTYAWFIGMQTVNVTSFDVEIKSTDSLLLSLDGERWSPELTLSETTLPDLAYVGNTNKWSKLSPVSSIGKMDVEASRLVLYEKASFTATPGGYRVMASRVDNTVTAGTEQDGYVAFDLFIRNFSGRQYIATVDQKDEEAIYMTTDSKVTVAAAGSGGVANTGLENSVRVAFTQVGRVNATETDPAIITGITCNYDSEEGKPAVGPDTNGVTGICRDARIWEPNDTAHVAAAISYYDTSCRTRKASPDGDDVTKTTSYNSSVKCTTVSDTNAYPTYVVNSPIASSDRVDTYDGYYNTYTSTTKLTRMEAGEVEGDHYLGYFTDTMRDIKGTDRPAFMYLAPDSVTKVRIYIYIEGQDIDNYDFSSIGKRISIQFGFTKEQLTPDDIKYDENGGPAIDTTRPAVTLTGENPFHVITGSKYTDPGATAEDPISVGNPGLVDLTSAIVIDTKALKLDASENITATPGTYYVTYSVTDASGNHSPLVSRTVIVDPAS